MARNKRRSKWGQGTYEFDKWFKGLELAEGQNAYQAEEAYAQYMAASDESKVQASLQNTLAWQDEISNAQNFLNNASQQALSQNDNGYHEFSKTFAYNITGFIPLDDKIGSSSVTTKIKVIVNVRKIAQLTNLQVSGHIWQVELFGYKNVASMENVQIGITSYLAVNGSRKGEVKKLQRQPNEQAMFHDAAYTYVGNALFNLPTTGKVAVSFQAGGIATTDGGNWSITSNPLGYASFPEEYIVPLNYS